MKKQINPTIKAHLLPNLFILLSLLAICTIPFARAQRNATKGSVAQPAARLGVDANMYIPKASAGTMSAPADSNISGAVREVPTMPQSRLPGVPTNSITTLFASNNFGNPGGAVYFDLTVASSPISVTALDINTAETVSFTAFRVYVLPGMTSQGNETNMALWTQVATGSGTGAGVDMPTHVTLSNPIPLNAGTLYGIALVADPAITHHYTNGTGSNQNYSNADAALFLGSASNVPFTAPVFSPRVWNGTIYYDVSGSTPTPTPTCTPGQYTIAQIGGSIVPGTTDTGNHGDDTVVTIALPFPYTLYDQTFTSINLSSNGNAQFTTTDTAFTNQCLPWLTHNYTIYPYWDDLYLVNAGFGIFTSISGTAPNRIFNIEWRAQYFPGSGSAGFELRLYEGQTRFDIIYGTVTNGNTSATAGVQKNDTTFAQYFCNGTGGAATGGQSYTLQGCATPTPTPTCTPAWRMEPPIVNARRNPATAAVGSNMYAITGFNAAPDYTAANESFNGTTWTTLAPIPIPHAQSRGAVVGSNIYVPGGFNSVSFGGPLDAMQIYNTATNSWSSGMSLPGTRGGVAAVAFNNLVYVIAGYTTPFPTVTNTVFIYNPGTNSYTTGAPMPAGQGNVAGVLYNGEIYVVGGGTAPGAQYAYNPTTNTWRTIAVLPTTNGTCQSDNGFVKDGELWIVGCLGLAINQQVWIYNSGTDSWRAGPPYSVDHQGPGAALFNGRGFVVGGGAAGGGSTAVESIGSCAPTVTGAVSRVTHAGGCGTFDISLPLTGTAGVEDRSTGGNYTVVVTFSDNETVTSASVTCHNPGTGTGTAGAVGGSGTPVITIPLTGVSNAQTLTVHIAGTTNVDIPMSILIGDTNGNGTVNAADIAQTKGRTGQAVTAANFRSDVNANCAINAGDIGLIKANTGTSVPGSCP